MITLVLSVKLKTAAELYGNSLFVGNVLLYYIKQYKNPCFFIVHVFLIKTDSPIRAINDLFNIFADSAFLLNGTTGCPLFPHKPSSFFFLLAIVPDVPGAACVMEKLRSGLFICRSYAIIDRRYASAQPHSDRKGVETNEKETDFLRIGHDDLFQRDGDFYRLC